MTQLDKRAQAVVDKLNENKEDCDSCDRKPSICANVVFHHPADKAGTKLLKSPAIIQSVNEDDTVNLVFFSVSGSMFFRKSITKGQKSYEWDWPDQVDSEKQSVVYNGLSG